jgi:hypothetical protein
MFKIYESYHGPQWVYYWRLIWWLMMPGTRITVKWPTDDQLQPANPNDAYRLWLEYNVGRQCWDWDWGWDWDADELMIKFRRGKGTQALQARLMWS